MDRRGRCPSSCEPLDRRPRSCVLRRGGPGARPGGAPRRARRPGPSRRTPARAPTVCPSIAEAVAVLVADRPEDARRVVDEREVVEHADDAGARGRRRPPKGSTRSPEVLALERDGHRVDREVAAEEILADRRLLDARAARPDSRRTRCGSWRRRRARRRRQITIAVPNFSCGTARPPSAAASARPNAIPSPSTAMSRSKRRLAHEDVAHGAADEVDAVERPSLTAWTASKTAREPLERPQPVGEVRRRGAAPRPTGSPSARRRSLRVTTPTTVAVRDDRARGPTSVEASEPLRARRAASPRRR